MGEIASETISAILQIVVFTLIPFVVFLFRKDKSSTFSRYLGLYRAPQKAITYALFTSLLFLTGALIFVLIDGGVRSAVFAPNSVTGKLRMMGLSGTSIVVLIIIALFKTSLSEEILFRGFIAKRLTKGIGFKAGNILQALIFGIIHLLLFWQLTNTTLAPLIGIFIFSTSAGWVVGYIKENHGEGSIVPGWIAHGLGNLISYFLIAFVI
jgi:uncharacterized protein